MMETKRLRPECVDCIIKSYLKKIPEGIDKDSALEYKQKMLKIVAEAPHNLSAPIITKDIKELQAQMFGIHDDYSEIKVHFNQLMLEFEGQMTQDVLKSDDPLKTAIIYAMLGNYIDFGAMDNVDENYLKELLKTVHNQKIDEDAYQKLNNDLVHAERLAYITDNCGEIVMDKILIKTIKYLYPQIEITVIVRGKPVINDATLVDAEQVGLTDIVKVVGN